MFLSMATARSASDASGPGVLTADDGCAFMPRFRLLPCKTALYVRGARANDPYLGERPAGGVRAGFLTRADRRLAPPRYLPGRAPDMAGAGLGAHRKAHARQ